MSLVPFIDEATTLATSLSGVCLAGAFIGCVLMLFESAFVLGFGGRGRITGGSQQPAVTVLKPLHGAEPELTGRLTAFCQQDYEGPVQVLCGAREASAPAANAVRTMQREHSDWPIELHVDPRRHGSNRKVSNLINMFSRVRHDVLVLSDSDIVVDQTYLRDVAALLAQPRAGAVTLLYHGIAGEGLWARLSALAVNTNFLPQAITGLALRAAKPCFGATIAVRRSMLEKIGGFGRFADELADDYAIGTAVRSAGYDVVIAPFLVGHVCFETSLRQFIRHQIRVARTVKTIDPIGYAGTIVTHPLPLALLGMLSGSAAAAVLAVAALASRIALCRCVEWRFGLKREKYWLVPLQDILAFAVYVASYFGATVYWRGAEYRVATDGSLIEDDPRHP